MTPSFRGVYARKFAEKKKKGLHELTRNLAEFCPRKFAFENFCSRSERERRAFFLGLICTSEPTVTKSASETRPTPSSTLVSPGLDSAQCSQPSQVGTSPHLDSNDVEMTGALSQKHSCEASNSQDFFIPNKTAKPQRTPDSPELSQVNAFDLFGSTSDVDLDSDDNDNTY